MPNPRHNPVAKCRFKCQRGLGLDPPPETFPLALIDHLIGSPLRRGHAKTSPPLMNTQDVRVSSRTRAATAATSCGRRVQECVTQLAMTFPSSSVAVFAGVAILPPLLRRPPRSHRHLRPCAWKARNVAQSAWAPARAYRASAATRRSRPPHQYRLAYYRTTLGRPVQPV